MDLTPLIKHQYYKITTRGNTAITAALSLFQKEDLILIPEEGGWLTYQKIPTHQTVKCDDAKLNLEDLKEQLQKKPKAIIYHNPGGYFAEQPIEEIYALCKQHDCLVIMDVAGSIGTELANGDYADIMVGSFGKWKLVEAKVGGFVSAKNKELLEKLAITELTEPKSLESIEKNLHLLPERINYLTKIKQKITEDLKDFNILRPTDLGFVVIVTYQDELEKEKILKYCEENAFEWTECPRYIRVNQPAISIEVKRR